MSADRISYREFDTPQKAFELNLDSAIYGTLAEIGGGQEVARWFFRVGGASGTIAKTMSAYDMDFSDAIYGPTKRYVSRERLSTMLDREYALLIERLQERRGTASKFFAFANTVATRSFHNGSPGRGWMGIRFQHEPGADASELIIHVRLHDEEVTRQQDALGIVGVNLIFGATKASRKLDDLLRSLQDNLGLDRIEIDMIQMTGPAFCETDRRLLALKLVKLGLTRAAMFNAQGEVVQASEALYQRPVLLERGSGPLSQNGSLGQLEWALTPFVQEPDVSDSTPLLVMEWNLAQLETALAKDSSTFLKRADELAALGHTVLISNYERYFKLTDYIFRATNKRVGLSMSVEQLSALFNEEDFQDLNGGILESIGRMFKKDLIVYVYPERHPANGVKITAENLKVAPHLRHLYAHLLENRKIIGLQGRPPERKRTLARVQAPHTSRPTSRRNSGTVLTSQPRPELLSA